MFKGSCYRHRVWFPVSFTTVAKSRHYQPFILTGNIIGFIDTSNKVIGFNWIGFRRVTLLPVESWETGRCELVYFYLAFFEVFETQSLTGRYKIFLPIKIGSATVSVDCRAKHHHWIQKYCYQLRKWEKEVKKRRCSTEYRALSCFRVRYSLTSGKQGFKVYYKYHYKLVFFTRGYNINSLKRISREN